MALKVNGNLITDSNTYGGGGAGRKGGNISGTGGTGADGVVRIVWGPGLSNTGRQFPSNSVGAL